jgi:hypothetical protein
VQQVALWQDDNRSLIGDPIRPPRTSTFALVDLSAETDGMDRDDTAAPEGTF